MKFAGVQAFFLDRREDEASLDVVEVSFFLLEEDAVKDDFVVADLPVFPMWREGGDFGREGGAVLCAGDGRAKVVFGAA